MKLNRLFVAGLSCISLFSIASCDGNKTIEVSSTLEMLENLKDCSNFTIDIYNTRLGDKGSIILNSSYYLNELNSYGYILDSNAGVYKFDVDSTGEICGNEIVTNGDTIYKNIRSLVNGFSSFELSLLDDEIEGNISIKDKTNREAFMKLVGESTTYYSYISSLTATYNKEENTLTFVLNYNDNLKTDNGNAYIKATVSDFGTSKSSLVEKYIKNGGTYFTPTEDMVNVRNKFKENNYTRYIYDSSNEVIGKEYFTKDYYCNNYYSGTTLAYNVGYISLVNKSYGGQTLQNGSYYFTTYPDPETEITPMLYAPAFQETNMSEIMNYPSNLEVFKYLNLFNYNEQYGYYFSNDYEITKDMYNNFGISNSGYSTVSLSGCGIKFGNASNDYQTTFYVIGSFDSTFGAIPFEFHDFGSTAHPGVEKFVAKLS